MTASLLTITGRYFVRWADQGWSDPAIDACLDVVRQQGGGIVPEQVAAREVIGNAITSIMMEAGGAKSMVEAYAEARARHRRRASRLRKKLAAMRKLLGEIEDELLPDLDFELPGEGLVLNDALGASHTALATLEASFEKLGDGLRGRGGNNDWFSSAFARHTRSAWTALSGRATGTAPSGLIAFATALWLAIGLEHRDDLSGWLQECFKRNR